MNGGDRGDHYEVLGVRPDAGASEIRAAYRSLARRYHPDRRPADAGAMAAINEAYRVLGDTSRRAVYDAARRGTGSAVIGASGRTSHGPPVTPSVTPPLPEPRYPWKLVIGMFVAGATIVLVGAALYEPASPDPPDRLLAPGSCVVIRPDRIASETTCTGGPDELVVTTVVGTDGQCPQGSTPYLDEQGMGLACVSAGSLP